MLTRAVFFTKARAGVLCGVEIPRGEFAIYEDCIVSSDADPLDKGVHVSNANSHFIRCR
jgi:hypothetical protein